MSNVALVLAAHGSDVEPSVNAQVRAYAEALAARGLFDEVAAAFHRGEPGFGEILDQLRCDDVIVVPLMTSVGYYSDTVLPRALEKHRSFPGKQVTQTPPIGVHPGIADLVTRRVRAHMQASGWAEDDTALALIGHGTPRHAASRNATFSLAQKLRDRNVCAQVLAAFLDDEPPVESLVERTEYTNLLVEPFLISDGPHTVGDIPRRLGLDPANDPTAPAVAILAGRRVLCDRAIGTDPGVLDIICDLAQRHLQFAEAAP